jgi:diguanylate cyclase (GGDEF)-like protein
MAIVTCEFLTSHGYRVPEDVVVTGFDGVAQEQYHTPRLTTAKQDNEKAGKLAVEIIDDAIHGKPLKKDYVVAHHVLIASSCGCKPVPPRNSNMLTLNLYNKLNSYKQFEKHMQEMISILTDTETLSEMISKTSSFIDRLAATELWICVRENFFNAEQHNPMYEYDDNYGTLRVLVHKDHTTYNDLPNFHVSEMLPNLMSIYEKKDEHFLLFSPLHFQEKTIGYIAVATEPSQQYMLDFNNHMSFSLTFSNILEIVQSHGELKQAISKLEEMYVQDYLTGLMNRRGFYKKLGEKISKLKQDSNKQFMVISIDLNGLKYINDVFGHGEGDNAIKTVARCMISNAVQDEICARFGGDEFVVAGIIEKDSNYADEYVTQFKNSIAYYNKYSNKPYEVGASCGVYIGLPTKEADVDEMIKRADDIMYEEKSHTQYKRGR